MEEEYEQRLADLKTDLANLRICLSEAGTRHREDERERALLMSTLTEQNQRLTEELEAATKREDELQKNADSLRTQFNEKRVTKGFQPEAAAHKAAYLLT